MPLKLVKRGRIWYMRGTVRGQPVYETCGTESRDAADALRIKRESEVYARTIAGPGVGRRFAEAAIAYMEQAGRSLGARIVVLRLVDHFGALELAQVTQDAIDRYVRARYPKAAPATIRRHVVTPITSVLRHASKRNWCPPPQFQRPKPPPGRVRWLTRDEADRLVAAAAPHLRPLLAFLLYTGARLSEALELDWREVDLVNRRAAFIDTKTGVRRGVPLHDMALMALANLPGRDGQVFRRPDGEPYADRMRLGGGQIKKAWAGACRRAGITNFTPHDCRHTFASWLTMAGTPLRTVAELLGHKTLDLVMRYSHLSPDHLRSAVDALPSRAAAVQQQKDTA